MQKTPQETLDAYAALTERREAEVAQGLIERKALKLERRKVMWARYRIQMAAKDARERKAAREKAVARQLASM